jgi:Planctomycete cytochrome C
MKVRPVLANNCYACHTDSGMGGLRLDSREALLKGGNSGPAIIPGKVEDSLLIQAVRQTQGRLKMPPSHKLTNEEIAVLVEWVGNGAGWPDPNGNAKPSRADEYVVTPEQRKFWSFQPIRKPAIPEVKNGAWAANDLDRFILASLEQKRLRPRRRGDKFSSA